MLIMDLKFIHSVCMYFILITVLLKTCGFFVSANIELEDEAIRQNTSEFKTCEGREDLAERFDRLETKFNLYEEDRNQLFQYFNTITEIMKRHIKLEEENSLLKNTLDEINGRLIKIENKSDSLKQNTDELKNDTIQTSEKVKDRGSIEQTWQSVLSQIKDQINSSRTCFGDSVEEINENIKALMNDTNEQKEEITYLKKSFGNFQNGYRAIADKIDKQSNKTRTFLEAHVIEVNENINALRNDTNEEKEEMTNLKKIFGNFQNEYPAIADEIDKQSNKTRAFLEAHVVEVNENINALRNDTNNKLGKQKVEIAHSLRNLQNDVTAIADSMELYAFSNNTFTTCGKVGSEGPSLAMCKEAYSQSAWTRFELYFWMQINGVQQWTVPKTSSYRIYAFGAKGGSGDNGLLLGGKGAKIVGTFRLVRGTVVNIVCGQMGSNGVDSLPGGGGGGTFLYTGSIGGDGLLIVAGGGGGGGEEDTQNGYNGQYTEYSLNAEGTSLSERKRNGGNGYGGIGGTRSTTGAGWNSDGNPMTGAVEGSYGKPGTRWVGAQYTANGGFGGGGSGCYSNGGGGGGGFTGGSGISVEERSKWGGGGAGSYNAGFNQLNETGQNNGHGYAIIKRI